jgi:hypothetical protein
VRAERSSCSLHAHGLFVGAAVPAQLLEMSLRRTGAVCRKCSTESEDTTFLFLPASLTQELLGGCDSRALQAQVNTHDCLRWGKARRSNADTDMQGEATFPRAQVSTPDVASQGLLCRDGHAEGQVTTTLDRGTATGHAFPLHPGGTSIRADRTDVRAGDPCFASLLETVTRTLDGLRCRDTRSTDELSRQACILGAQIRLGLLLHVDPSAALARTAHLSHGSETRAMLLKGCLAYPGLRGRGFQRYVSRAIHTNSRSSRLCFGAWDAQRAMPMCSSPGLKPGVSENGGF